ncbi:MAG TPA: hypothetical protein VIL86_10775 [Tepidisphaeraceae bacterium]|jgi:hypothetical protein
MANNARKKEKHRLKRKQRQNQLRRAKSISPFTNIAARSEIISCCVNADWRERGQAVPFVLRRCHDGTLAFASYMVDLWCAGFKDAWCEFAVPRDRFEEVVDNMEAQMDEFVEVDVEEIIEIVAGGIRFAHQNGFRLPRHYDRNAAFLGQFDWREASLENFGKDGKLLWVAPLEDLRRRLVNCSVDDFLARPDVDYIMGIGEDSLHEFEPTDESGDLEEEEEDEAEDALDVAEEAESAEVLLETIEEVADRFEAGIKRWCQEKQIDPPPLFHEAVRISTAAMLLAGADARERAEDPIEALTRRAKELTVAVPPDIREEVFAGIDLFKQFFMSFPSKKEMLQAVNFPTDLPGLEQ